MLDWTKVLEQSTFLFLIDIFIAMIYIRRVRAALFLQWLRQLLKLTRQGWELFPCLETFLGTYKAAYLTYSSSVGIGIVQ